MVAIAYFLPPVVCLFVFYVCGIDTPEPYAWILVSGWAAAGLTHRLCYRNRTKATEYLGAFIWGLFYEEPWTEREVIVETYTDKNGNTHERRRVVYTHHSEVFYFKTNIGTRHLISSESYSLICTTWNAPRHGDLWSGSEIVGGVRYGHHFYYAEARESESDPTEKLFTITETHSYTNKIRNSNSIFRFEKITGEEADRLGLIDYPEINNFDAPTVLSRHFNIAPNTERAFRVFNSIFAPKVEMHLFILLFDASTASVNIVDKQRSFWHGGNKNEFVVCIGLKGEEVEWARAFSWADEPVLEVKTVDWFRRNPRKELIDFLSWLKENYTVWKRKEFSDFNYIRVSLAMWQVLIVMISAVAGSLLSVYLELGK